MQSRPQLPRTKTRGLSTLSKVSFGPVPSGGDPPPRLPVRARTETAADTLFAPESRQRAASRLACLSGLYQPAMSSSVADSATDSMRVLAQESMGKASEVDETMAGEMKTSRPSERSATALWGFARRAQPNTVARIRKVAERTARANAVNSRTRNNYDQASGLDQSDYDLAVASASVATVAEVKPSQCLPTQMGDSMHRGDGMQGDRASSGSARSDSVYGRQPSSSLMSGHI